MPEDEEHDSNPAVSIDNTQESTKDESDIRLPVDIKPSLDVGPVVADGTDAVAEIKQNLKEKPVICCDWSVDCSDDEKYTIEPAEIKELYEQVSNRPEQMILEWKTPKRRRSPISPKESMQIVEMSGSVKDLAATDNVNISVPGYDFDEPSSDLRPAPQPAPRRTSGVTPRSTQKRVARLDKIINDIERHKKLDDDIVDSQKSVGSRSQHKRGSQTSHDGK